MNHKRTKKPAVQIPNCVKGCPRPQVAGRDDKLCASCAHYADMAKSLVGKK